jgi:hypothetical protein
MVRVLLSYIFRYVGCCLYILAADNKVRDPKMDMLKITIDRASNTISVYNNGRYACFNNIVVESR